MVPVIYAPEAERDLDAITAYIAKDNPKAAEQFEKTNKSFELDRIQGVRIFLGFRPDLPMTSDT